MKMNSAKRVLSLILAAVLLLGNIPATVFATEEDGGISATEAVVETMEPTAAVTEPPAEETAAPTEETVAPTQSAVPEETAAPTEETATPSEAAEPTEVTVSDEAAMAAATVVASGTFGEEMGLTWVLDTEGTLTISGTGDMDYDWYPPWCDPDGISGYESYIKTVIIDDGVTNIGPSAFAYCERMTSVSIPDSVTSIGRAAFGWCLKLESITLPDSVTEISSAVFTYCTSLISIVIPGSVTSLADGIFEGCDKLKSITFVGNAPQERCDSCLYGVETTVYYPANNPTWTSEVMEECEGELSVGKITWIPYRTPEYHNTLAELTAVDYLAFSQVAYEDFTIGETVQSCFTRVGNNKWNDVWGEEHITYAELCEGIAQWKVCHIEENDDNGFYAVAFRNDSGEAVLAYRGSKPLENILQMFTDEQSYKDWVLNDLPMILLNADNDKNQYDSAIAAYEKTKKVSGIHTIVTTGHSLGGLWGDIASAYSGCQGITFNAISALDIMYVKHPKELGKSFKGVNVWNFKDHANVLDILAGATEIISSGLIFGTRLKPYMTHASNYAPYTLIWEHHGLKSLVSRDGDRLKLNAAIDSWYATKGVSNHLLFTDGSIDMGISGNDYFNQGIYSGAFRTSFGGNGNDKIYGSIYADVLVGGKGADTLDGGWGNDTYYYFKGDGSDTIIDCHGQDKLYLEGFSASDQISISAEDKSKYVQIKCNGNTIVQIYNSRVATVIGGIIVPGVTYPSTPMKPMSSFNICVNGDEIDITQYFSTRTYESRLLIENSASIEILNSDGDWVYTLGTTKEGVYYTDYGNFYIYKEDGGSCGKALDLAKDYTARIIGRESGTMNLEYWEILPSGEVHEATKTFTNVPVSEKFTAMLEKTDDGELVLAADTDGDEIVDAKLGYDGKPVPAEAVDLTQEYIVLKPKQTFTLQAQAKPAELTPILSWSVEEGSENIIRIEQDGSVTGLNVGTGYVLVTLDSGGNCVTDRCRIDVAQTEAIPEPTEAPTEPSEEPTAPSGDLTEPPGPEGSMGVAIVGVVMVDGLNVRTEPSTTSNIVGQLPLDTFIVIWEERTVDGILWGRIDEGWVNMHYVNVDVWTDEANEEPPEDGRVILEGIQFSTNKVTTELYKDDFATFEILLDLPQNRPENAAMISNPAANAGAKKSNIIDSVRFEKNSDLFELEMLDDRTAQIVPTQKALDSGKTVKSSYTDTVIVTIQGREYPITEKLTLSVKKTMPKLKATIAAFNSFYEGQAQAIVITGDDVTGIRANGNKATAIPAWLTLENGCLKLNGATPKSSDKAYLWIDVDGWRVPAELTLNVKHSYKAPTLKLPATSVSLNSLNGDKKEIVVTSSFADYVPSDLEITHNAGDALTIEKEGNHFTVSTNDKTAHNKTYKITVKTANSKIKAVTLTVKTVGKAPTMNSLKLKGTLDVTFPENKLTIGVTMKDYADAFEPTLIIKDSKGNDVTEQFTTNWNGAEFEVAPNGAVKGTYTVSVSALGLEKTAKLTVKETLPKIKLSATKVTLNKNLNHSVEIDITSVTKGYELKSSVHVEAPAQVKAVAENGKLTVSLNESAEYGKTYKVTVSAYKGAPAVSLSIAVPKKDKSDVSATIKATGFIDVIRGESAITITPTFVNAYASDMESMELKFYKRNGKVWEDVTEGKYFHAEEVDGKFIVTAEENLTSADKYQAELVYKVGGKELKSKQIALTLKMGTAKVTVKSSDTTMFAKDRNDRALVWFEATDLTLNDVAKIEIKDAKYKDAFTIIDYEDGTFGLAFKDGKIHKEIEKLVAKKTSATITLNLNVFIDGNTTTKANATQKVTLTIVK